MTLTLGLMALATVGAVASLALTCLLVVRFPLHAASLLGVCALLAAGWTGQLSALLTLIVGACLYGVYGLLRFICQRPPLAALVIIALSAGFVRAAIEGAKRVSYEPTRAPLRHSVVQL